MANEPATGVRPAQDITSRVEAALFPVDDVVEEGAIEEPELTEGDEVLEDDDEGQLPEDDDSEAEDAEGSDGDDDEDEVEYEDVDPAELAEYLGLETDKLAVKDGKLLFNAKIDGEIKPVPLKDMVASYQLQGHVNNQSIALSNERKEFEQVRTQATTMLQEKLGDAAQLSEALEQKLLSDYQNIDWNALRTEDPTEWVALRQEMSEQANAIKTQKESIKQKQQQLLQEQRTEFQRQQQSHLKQEIDKMVSNNPTWSDPEVMKTEVIQMRDFLSNSYGFGEQELESVTDSRLVSLIQDAMAFRNGKQKLETKKVKKKLPRFQKPGAAKQNAANLAKARKVKANKANIKNSGGSVESIAKSLVDRM